MKSLIKSIPLFLILNLLGANFLHSQEEHTYKKNPVEGKNIISANILGTTGVVGLSYERLIKNRVGLEVGGGYWIFGNGYGAGATVYPFNEVRTNAINLYTGVKYSYRFQKTLSKDYWSTRIYVPVGCTLFSDWLFSISADIGPSFNDYDPSRGDTTNPYLLDAYNNEEKVSLYGSVKVGFRF